MEWILVGLVTALTVAVLGFVAVLYWRFHGHPFGQRWAAWRARRDEISRRIAELQKYVSGAENDLRRRAREYEYDHIRRVYRRQPIRALSSRISVSMSWKALERAGIETVDDLLRFRGSFTHLKGIGQARAQALQRARRELEYEQSQMTVPPPTVHGRGDAEFRPVVLGLKVLEMRRKVMPKLRTLSEEQGQLEARVPSSLSLWWRFWSGDQEDLEADLVELEEALDGLGGERLEELETYVESSPWRSRSLEAITEAYEAEGEALRTLLDEMTTRPMRGHIRPVGRAAMRSGEGFDNEEDFCDRGLDPLMDRLGYRFEREYRIQRRIGSSDKTLFVDFMLKDRRGRKVALLEAKRHISNDRQLEDATEQAYSYALFEGLDPVMVAAPEGLWLYERQEQGGQEMSLRAKYGIEEAYDRADELRKRIERIAGRDGEGGQARLSTSAEVRP